MHADTRHHANTQFLRKQSDFVCMVLSYLSHYDLMSHSPTHISIHDITTKYPKPADPRRLSICKLFSWNTSHSHDNLRRVSKSPLLHPFTHRRSGTLDWRVTKATSADSSRLIHTILAHSSTPLYLSIFRRHRTVCPEARRDGHHLGVNLGSAETVRSTEMSGTKSTWEWLLSLSIVASGKRNYCNRSSGKWCILHYF
jgi:hypothetical protein